MTKLPQRQRAVQLVGPDELVFNDCKKVVAPGPHQILCRVEVVGLCFSDLKLLKQFSSHVRKGEVVSGIEPSLLKEIPSYVPAKAPTVPGHEAVVTVAAVGPEVSLPGAGDRLAATGSPKWRPSGVAATSLPIEIIHENVPTERGKMTVGYQRAAWNRLRSVK